MNDYEIVNMYLERNEEAIKETEKQYANYCFKIAYSILNDYQDAEECLNDVYQGVWNSIPPHKPNNLKTYIGRITRNLALNIYRHNTALKRTNNLLEVSFDELSECVADNRSIKDEIDASMLAEMINDFLGNLKEDDRKFFVCRYYYFETVNEIAEHFNTGVSRVKMSLKRTRDHLRIYLEKEGICL